MNFNTGIYSRLWVLVLNPLNLSVAGGGAGYYNRNATTAEFSLMDNVYTKQVLEHEAIKGKFGFGYFYEAKLMFNFRNWGISGGISKYTLEYDYDPQITAGFWFGLKARKPVIN